MRLCGENIRKLRRENDLTQEYMAYEMGISQKAYSDIENSKVKVNLDTLTKVSNILKVSPSDICSISHQCSIGTYKEKFDDLVDYLRSNGISIPDSLK
jgi:transcriptional regulator with XRE-family HTH domain